MVAKKYFTEEERLEAKRESDRRAQRKAYAENPEKFKAKNAKWRRENPEKAQESNRTSHAKRYNDPSKFPLFLMHGMKSRKRVNGKTLTLTIEDVEQLIIDSKGVCALSGLPLTCERKHPNLASIDRIDSRKGYVKGNVQLVAKCVNLAKNAQTDAEFIAMCKAVVDFNS